MPGRRQGPGESSNSLHPQGECGYWGHTHMPAIRIQYSNQYKESVLIQRVVEAEMKHLGLLEDVRKASEELAFDLALKQLACLTKRSKEFLGENGPLWVELRMQKRQSRWG